MKAVRTHEYRIDGYGTVTFIRNHLGSRHYPSRFFGGEREKKRESALPGCKKAESRRRSWRCFTARWLALSKMASTGTITTTKI